MTAPSTSIVAANQEVPKVLAMKKSASGSKQCGTYTKYTPKQKATMEIIAFCMEQVPLLGTLRSNFLSYMYSYKNKC